MFSPYPLTPAVGPRDGQRLRVVVPDKIVEDVEEHNNALLDRSLQQSWDQARARFKRETGEDLGDYRSTKQGILGTLKQQYGSDSKEAKKRDDIHATVELVLNGVELVAATAAQAASVVFGPAQLCFNALDVLLSIPRAVKKYTEDLQSLFGEVSSYLNNFRIYDRIDRRGALDVALLTSNNDILIALVELCMLAWKVIKNPIKTILGNALLKNEAIGNALSGFKDLIDKQNQLTSTLTLETVLKSESLSRQIKQRTVRIDETTTETNVIVKGLAAENAQNKNLKLDRDRILKIERSLDLNDALVGGPLEALKMGSTSMFKDTITLLEDHDEFKSWRDSTDQRRMLYIGGDTSSGKTNVLSALARHVEAQKTNLHAQQKQAFRESGIRDDRSIYLTYYSFSNAAKMDDRGKFATPVHVALKVIAAQLARQSTRYASALSDQVDTIQRDPKNLLDLWKALNLSEFCAPDNSILYMFFDGIEKLKSSLQDLGKILRSLKPQEALSGKEMPLKLRVILTGSPGNIKKLAVEDLPSVNISEINEPLIRAFVEDRLRNLNIFQDGDADSVERREQVLKVIPETSRGSFNIAEQKIKIIEEAIEEDIDFEVLIEKLRLTLYNTLAEQGLELLNRVSKGTELSIQHKEQLRELLIWTTYGMRNPVLDVLEAALYLQHDKKSLEPLKRKIETRFEDFLEIENGTVYPRDSMREVSQLSWIEFTHDPTEKAPPGITVNVSVENADDSSLKQIVSQLGMSIGNVNLNFSSSKGKVSGNSGLLFHYSEAECTIITRLLRALTDDRVRRQATPLIEYAATWLPTHLRNFRLKHLEYLPTDDVKIIGAALINFLWDEDSIASAWNVKPFDGEDWLNRDSIDAIAAILQYNPLLKHLDPVQRRWAKKNAGKTAAKAAFLDIMARTVVNEWLTDHSQKVSAIDCFWFIDSYLIAASSWTGPTATNSIPLLRRSPKRYSKCSIGSHHDIASQKHGDEDEQANVIPMHEPDIIHTVSEDEPSQVDDLSHANPAGHETLAEEEHGSAEESHLPHPTKFTESSTDIRLLNGSILTAVCLDYQGVPRSSSISLNDCLSVRNGLLEWARWGRALETAQNVQLLENGKTLELVLPDRFGQHRWQSIELDEQIYNDDGMLVFREPDWQPIYVNDTVTESYTSSAVDLYVSSRERLKRAEEWMVNNLRLQLDSFALFRMGAALLVRRGDMDTAQEYFNRIESDTQSPWKSVGTSLVHARRENYREALDALQHALIFFRSSYKSTDDVDIYRAYEWDTSSELEWSRRDDSSDIQIRDDTVRDLFTCLNQAAQYNISLQEEFAAIELLEEAIRNQPLATDCRWLLIKLLTKNHRFARAEELLREWKDLSEDHLKLESPGAYFRKRNMLRSFHGDVYPVLCSSKGTEVFKHIAEAFRDALDKATAEQDEYDTMKILLLQGIIFATLGGKENLEAACQAWIDSQRLARLSDDSDRGTMYESSNFAAMHFFDRAKEHLDSVSKMTAYDAEALIADVKANIGRVSTSQEQFDGWDGKPTVYVAAIASLTGQPQIARSVFKEDMASVVDILTDDDLYNDRVGLTKLCGILLHCGDTEGALSAWSLFDREYTRHRAGQFGHGQADNIDNSENIPPVDEDDDGILIFRETGGKSETIIRRRYDETRGVDVESVVVRRRDSYDSYASRSDFNVRPVTRNMLVDCTSCDMFLRMAAECAEVWRCLYCPGVWLCTTCKENLQKDQREKYMCNPSHDFFLLKHYDYTEEELEGDKVRVGWKWENVEADSADGQGTKVIRRERVGGTIMELNEWVEILRQEWGIEKTKSEGKLQL